MSEEMKLTGDRCQCRACGEYFNSTFSFDKHRKGTSKDRVCKSPSDIGMSKNERGFWISSVRPRLENKTA